MSRVLIVAVIMLLLFGGLIAADEMLSNPDVQSVNNSSEQQTFAETSSLFIQLAPVGMFALVVGAILAGVRRAG